MTLAERLERPSCPDLDSILGVPTTVLDHGFIRVIDYMGDEAAIVQAARVSYGKGTKTPSGDVGLLRYLLRNRHTTPFEMCEIKLHVKLPIFVARQWIRHRTANVNEYSARYSILSNEFYVPDPGDILRQSTSNKQGRGGELPEDVRRSMAATIEMHGANSYDLYWELLTGWPFFNPDGERWAFFNQGGERWAVEDAAVAEPHKQEHGMARELARMVLPANAYTEWYWKTDVHNLMHFLSLRADPHAQKEIREYALSMSGLLWLWLPNVAQAWQDYIRDAESFSGPQMKVLLRHLSRFPHLTIEEGDLTKADERELLAKLKLAAR